MIYGRLPPVTHVRDAHGVAHSDLAAMDDLLWDSRKDIWGTAPPVPARAEAILDYYFRDRPSLSGVPLPSTAEVLGHILQPGGSAPGHDGIGYEPLHFAANFVAHLIAQALHAADSDSLDLDRVLGDSVDLLVWTVEALGADTPAGLRPLQLPSCFRRIFGAVLAGAVGPAIEPHLTAHQAAVAGGTCGPNVTAAFRHLAPDAGRASSATGGDPPQPCAAAWVGRGTRPVGQPGGCLLRRCGRSLGAHPQ